MARVILFDVNETLLDLGALDSHFARAFGEAEVRRNWFQTLKEIWLVSIVTGSYQDFNKLAEAALQMTAEKQGVSLSSKDHSAILDGMKELPPHPEVAGALEQLRDAGLRLAALTNGTLSSARAQLRYAELTDYFEEIFSADEVERFKPAREPYTMAAERLRVEPSEVRMVAAHAWDIAGAKAAGLATGFVARPGQVLNPAGAKPDLRATDLAELARTILREDDAE